MARPTKYTKDTVEKAKAYLVDYQHDGSVIPSAAGLALYLGIRKSTLYEWAKDEDKQEFSDTLAELQQRQESILLANGLRGDFNAAITKLALANHGYSDKSEQTLQGPGGGAINVAWEVLPVAGNQAASKDS